MACRYEKTVGFLPLFSALLFIFRVIKKSFCNTIRTQLLKLPRDNYHYHNRKENSAGELGGFPGELKIASNSLLFVVNCNLLLDYFFIQIVYTKTIYKGS